MRSDNLRSAPNWLTPELVGRVLDLAMPAGVTTLPVVTVPTRGVKPTLEIVPNSPPVAHSRRPEGGAESSRAAPPSTPRRTGLHEDPEFQQLMRIADQRGIAIVDLAHAVGGVYQTVLVATKRLGHAFGMRKPLADPLTKAKLLELADESVPLPELRCDRLKRERYEKWNAQKRDRRAEDRKDDPSYRPHGARKPKPATPSEAKHPPACQAVRSAAPREPAPHSPARAQPLSDRAKFDRASALQRAAVRRRIERQAIALLDGDDSQRSTGGHVNSVLAAAMIEIRHRRAAEARAACPIEQAKLALQRANYRPVCSMAVYGGSADLFCVGQRKDLTRDELLELAAKVAA